MKKLFIIIGMLLTMVGNILADNLSVADIKLAAGEERQIAVNLTNTEHNYVAFQFDLLLPEGVAIAKDSKGRFVASITEERIIDHILTISDVGSNTYRVLSYSGTNAEYFGKEGTLLNITLKASDSFGYGDYSAKIVTPKFTESNGSKYTFPEVSFAIQNQEPVSAIIITATDASRLYGDANPTFSYSVSGGTLQGEPEITCVATPTSAVGQYAIVVSKGTVTNPDVTFVNGTLDVQKAPLTIKADNKQINQGDLLPEFTATYTGFKNNETEAVLSKKPQFQCSATSNSEAGTYDIVPSGAEAENYAITYQNGTLTVIPLPVPDNDKFIGEDVELETGKDKETAFSLINPGRKYVAFQFDLILPEGITIAKDSKGRFAAKLNDDRIIDHTLTVSAIGNNNTYRLLAYSGSNAEFVGDNGTLVSVTLNANCAGGNYTASLTNQKFTVADGTKYSFDDVTFGIKVIAGDIIIVTATDASRLYGDANPTFKYSVSGGTLQGDPEITCVATPTSSVGQYAIVVSKGTVSNPNVTFVNGTLDVQKAPLTIKADDKQINQGDPLPVFTATYTGFKNNETDAVLSKKPQFQCSATSNSEAGAYDIVPIGAEATNYEISYANGKLTISKQDAAIVVRVKDCSRYYGDDNPEFEYTVEGGTLNAEPRITCYAYKTSDVGEYEIKINWGSYKDADVTFVGGTLTVLPAPLTVAVGNYTKKHGKVMPDFEITYNGFKNGQSTYTLEKKAIATCEATEESAPGNYEIVVSGAEAKNYEMVYQNGTLTVIPAIVVRISNPKAGQIESNVATSGYQKNEIDELIVTGLLNGTDIKYIREMIIDGELTSLDIKDSRIVSGGEAYYKDFISYTTDNDIVGSNMFYECKNLMFLHLPNSAIKIDLSAIVFCDNLKVLDLPVSCEELGSYGAITNCERLEQVNIFAKLHTIGSMNFGGCPNLKAFNVVDTNNWYSSEDGVLFSKDKKNLLIYPMGKVDVTYIIPEGTEQIEESAFESAILQELYIPSSIIRIGEQAFSWCENLTTIWSFIQNLNGVAFTKDYFGEVTAFKYMNSNCTWHVIEGTSGQYTSEAWWVDIWAIIDDIGHADPYPDSVGITPLQYNKTEDGVWYTLQGERLDGKPSKMGIYIIDGKKVIIK